MTRRPLTDEAAVDLLHRLVAIPSVSGHEAQAADFLAETMTGLGLDATVDEVGNAVGRTGTGDGPTVVLLSHVDTVPGDVEVRRTGDALFGRGSVDAKGPLAAMVSAAARARDFPGTLVVAGVVEEETPGSRGAMHVRRTWRQPDALIVGEPSGWQNIVVGYKGKLDLRYRVSRPATHPSNPAEKASEAAAAFWHDALAAAGPDPSHAVFDRPGVTLVSISGDLEDAVLELSYRTPPGFDEEALRTRLTAALRGGDLDTLNSVSAVRSPRRDPVVRALSAAIRRTGGAPTPVLKTATSDMNTLAEVWPVPMATYGPGDSDLDHSDHEHILLADYLRGIDVLGGALAEFAESSALTRSGSGGAAAARPAPVLTAHPGGPT
ncbi:M20/M25/M40 family metallo-hydrolase [Streptomyces sp. ODS05-4]|uniref:M20/M25/M40 family metallo-hydrolase n=1 Tax=Streptomyces sp. ODS05-4 TaxID=2944939 RepID=UPI00210E3CED|nr:M20/M25/M40 family metallo-hydrolase [Streptomyces sp. ODS05-4]